jgi:hypothetical protein
MRKFAARGLRLDRVLTRCQGRGVDVEATARPEQVCQHHAEHQGEGGHDFEVDQGLQADPPDRLDVAHMRDAGHHHAEDQRRDDHLDEPDEAVAEWAKILAQAREEMADRDAGHDCGQELEEQGFVDGPLPGGGGGIVDSCHGGHVDSLGGFRVSCP